MNFFFVGSAYVFFEPILANELNDYYKLPASESALMFFAFLGPFGMGGLFLLVIPERIPRRGMMIIMGLIAGVACYMMGPAYPFPRMKEVLVVGLALAGVSSAMSMNSSSGESLKAMKPLFPEHYEDLADLNAKLINIGSSLNNLVNPLIAAAFESRFNYRHTCALYGLVILSFSLLYAFAHLVFIPKDLPSPSPRKAHQR